MINLYAMKCPNSIEDELYHQFLQVLPEEKRVKVLRFKKREDSYRTLLADILVRTLICETCKLTNEDITFGYNPYGKPFLQQFPRFAFNVSHSGEWIVCITHYADVGIDVEQIRPIDLEMAKRFFAREEYQDLLTRHPDEQLAYFYDLWTLKESYIKALGQGLSIPLHSFIIRKHGENAITVSQHDSNAVWYFRQYAIDDRYKLSACGTVDQFADQVVMKDMVDLQKMIR